MGLCMHESMYPRMHVCVHGRADIRMYVNMACPNQAERASIPNQDERASIPNHSIMRAYAYMHACIHTHTCMLVYIASCTTMRCSVGTCMYGVFVCVRTCLCMCM
jgi:hypothetical protein